MLIDQIDPKTIIVHRSTRQRQENIADIEDLKQSISSIGLINPITVRRNGDEIVLMAGERRLLASLSLGLPLVAVRYIEDLSEEEAEVIELEENIKRRELHWRDQVKAIGRLHKLLKQRNADWSIDRTAEAVSIGPKQLRKVLHVYEAIDSNKLTQAEGIEQAYNTLQRFAERKAESVVASIVATGAKIFDEEPKVPTAVPTAGVGDFNIQSPVSTFDDPPPSLGEATTTTTTSTAVTTALGATTTTTTTTTATATTASATASAQELTEDPIICADFLKWAETYSGPKFSLIHCDFPYGNYRGDDSSGSIANVDTEEFYDNHEQVYWNLLEGLTWNLDRIMSYSAHLIFWFNMNFYTETVKQLRATGLFVHDHPLVWHKTPGGGGFGVVPGTAVTYPRRTYDTALLCVRGRRPLAKPGSNSYAAPTVGNKIHPSQKPEPMLRHFLSMVVDETTSVLDPTCGSGAALRAAEDLGARSILGLELDPNYVASANLRTKQARVLRQAGMLNKNREQ